MTLKRVVHSRQKREAEAAARVRKPRVLGLPDALQLVSPLQCRRDKDWSDKEGPCARQGNTLNFCCSLFTIQALKWYGMHTAKSFRYHMVLDLLLLPEMSPCTVHPSLTLKTPHSPNSHAVGE